MEVGTSRLQALAAAGVVVGLALTACSSGGMADDEHAGPLDAYLDEIGGGWDTDALTARVEELIAACMTEAGFDYVPVTGTTGESISTAGYGTLEFAEEFGYGYTFESDGPGTGTFYWPLPPEESPAQQANRAYVESLSDAAEQEYNTALIGDLLDPIEDPDTFDAEAIDRGCRGRANAQVNETNATPEFSEVLEAVNQVPQLVAEDPRVTEATTAWSGCMAEAGYPTLTAISDAENLVNDLVNDFMATNFPGMDPEYDAIRASAPEELAELQAEEIAAAVADATCREDVGYSRIEREVSDEYEQTVVDLYQEELEAWVEVTREQKAAQ